jgi:alpha-L-rhamnosidase
MFFKIRIWLTFSLLSLCITLKAQTTALQVAELHCQSSKNPLGVESKNPVLSWQTSSNLRGAAQLAYQILVADNEEKLRQNIGNIWDSKKVISSQSLQITYNGMALKAGNQYYWKVKVWDNKGNAKWSSPAYWQMGLFNTADWKGALWIGYEKMAEADKIVPAINGAGKKEIGLRENILPLLRKEFVVSKQLKKATIFISGLGHFDLSLNGEKVGDHFLDPGWTQYDKEAFYVTFDLTKKIAQGNNAIGVMLGNGFYHIPNDRYRKLTGSFGYPKMICKLVLEYHDGTTENIISNTSWKTAPGPITFSSIFGGENFDANLMQVGWDKPSFDDKSWKSALSVDGIPKLSNQIGEPLKVMEIFVPKKITQPQLGKWLYDLGQNFSGIPQIIVKGKKGAAVKILPGEILGNGDAQDPKASVNQSPSGSPSYFIYTLKGAGNETWQPQFMYYGFRYLQIEGAVPEGQPNPESLPVVVGLKGLHTRNAAAKVGEFNCSNGLFNDIFKLIDWSVKSNMASVLTDCPHREKLGWLEVPHLLGNSIRYNYDINTFYAKIVQDMKLAQKNNGLIPSTAPDWVVFGPDFRDSPEWGSSSVIVPWYLYQWYGDKNALKNNYDMMVRYVDYLGTKGNNHIVSHGLGEWFDVDSNSKGSGYSVNTPQGITGTAIYYYDINILSKTASLLGKNDDVKKYTRLGEQVRIAFNNKFFDKEKKVYGTNSQAANAMAIYMDLVEPQYKAMVLHNLITDIQLKKNRLSTGEVGFPYLLEVLESAGRSDIIYDMNNRSDVPGYGFQLAHGATTLMESWQAVKTSLGNNHCMLGHLMGWFYSGLAGIRPAPNSIAFKEIVIKPEPVGDVKFAKASYQSPYGTIVSDWTKEKDEFELSVTIPFNTTATIYLPATSTSVITENGQEVGLNKIFVFMGLEQGKASYKIPSGQYKFKVKG